MPTKKFIGEILILVTFVFQTMNTFVSCNSALDLKNHLFQPDRYDKTVRPVLNWTTLTTVDLHMSVIAILDFNDVEETIAMTAILELSWTDELLTWDSTKFDNLSHISVPQNDVWRPYLSLENSVMKMGELGTPSLVVDIHRDGKVEWRPIEVLMTSCPVDVAKFPFDTQRCGLTFETNGYEHDELELNVEGSEVELHEYKGTSGWIIKSTKFERTVEVEHGTTHIVCWITLERKPMYFILNIFLPICLLTLLNLFVFVLPVESGEKVSFVVTIFLSLAVFLTIVSGEMPENSESISLLNAYVFTSTIMSTLTVMITIVEIRLHSFGSDRSIPTCLRIFTKFWASSSKVGHTSEDETDFEGYMRTKNVNRNSVKSVATVQVNTKTPKMNWHRVVKSLDNFFFTLFLLFYIGFTLVWIIIATKS